jgi:YfiH family protein
MAKTAKGFQLIENGELAFLQSPLLEQSGMVDHAFSTRRGGCSTGAVQSLNTAFHTGDTRERVLENRRRLLKPWGYDPAAVVAGIQVHGTDIALVTAQDRGRGALPGTFLTRCDALVTATPGVVLTAYSADCLLLFLVAPRERVIALAHAGWRGTRGGMARKVVNYLVKHFAVDPATILAALSPGICAKCYRVDSEVAENFRTAGWGGAPYLTKASPDGYFHLDLAEINRHQLLNAGLREENLAGSGWCSSCRADLFYSYRRDRGVTGRMLGFMAIKP